MDRNVVHWHHQQIQLLRRCSTSPLSLRPLLVALRNWRSSRAALEVSKLPRPLRTATWHWFTLGTLAAAHLAIISSAEDRFLSLTLQGAMSAIRASSTSLSGESGWQKRVRLSWAPRAAYWSIRHAFLAWCAVRYRICRRTTSIHLAVMHRQLCLTHLFQRWAAAAPEVQAAAHRTFRARAQAMHARVARALCRWAWLCRVRLAEGRARLRRLHCGLQAWATNARAAREAAQRSAQVSRTSSTAAAATTISLWKRRAAERATRQHSLYVGSATRRQRSLSWALCTWTTETRWRRRQVLLKASLSALHLDEAGLSSQVTAEARSARAALRKVARIRLGVWATWTARRLLFSWCSHTGSWARKFTALRLWSSRAVFQRRVTFSFGVHRCAYTLRVWALHVLRAQTIGANGSRAGRNNLRRSIALWHARAVASMTVSSDVLRGIARVAHRHLAYALRRWCQFCRSEALCRQVEATVAAGRQYFGAVAAVRHALQQWRHPSVPTSAVVRVAQKARRRRVMWTAWSRLQVSTSASVHARHATRLATRHWQHSASERASVIWRAFTSLRAICACVVHGGLLRGFRLLQQRTAEERKLGRYGSLCRRSSALRSAVARWRLRLPWVRSVVRGWYAATSHAQRSAMRAAFGRVMLSTRCWSVSMERMHALAIGVTNVHARRAFAAWRLRTRRPAAMGSDRWRLASERVRMSLLAVVTASWAACAARSRDDRHLKLQASERAERLSLRRGWESWRKRGERFAACRARHAIVCCGCRCRHALTRLRQHARQRRAAEALRAQRIRSCSREALTEMRSSIFNISSTKTLEFSLERICDEVGRRRLAASFITWRRVEALENVRADAEIVDWRLHAFAARLGNGISENAKRSIAERHRHGMMSARGVLRAWRQETVLLSLLQQLFRWANVVASRRGGALHARCRRTWSWRRLLRGLLRHRRFQVFCYCMTCRHAFEMWLGQAAVAHAALALVAGCRSRQLRRSLMLLRVAAAIGSWRRPRAVFGRLSLRRWRARCLAEREAVIVADGQLLVRACKRVALHRWLRSHLALQRPLVLLKLGIARHRLLLFRAVFLMWARWSGHRAVNTALHGLGKSKECRSLLRLGLTAFRQAVMVMGTGRLLLDVARARADMHALSRAFNTWSGPLADLPRHLFFSFARAHARHQALHAGLGAMLYAAAWLTSFRCLLQRWRRHELAGVFEMIANSAHVKALRTRSWLYGRRCVLTSTLRSFQGFAVNRKRLNSVAAFRLVLRCHLRRWMSYVQIVYTYREQAAGHSRSLETSFHLWSQIGPARRKHRALRRWRRGIHCVKRYVRQFHVWWTAAADRKRARRQRDIGLIASGMRRWRDWRAFLVNLNECLSLIRQRWAALFLHASMTGLRDHAFQKRSRDLTGAQFQWWLYSSRALPALRAWQQISMRQTALESMRARARMGVWERSKLQSLLRWRALANDRATRRIISLIGSRHATSSRSSRGMRAFWALTHCSRSAVPHYLWLQLCRGLRAFVSHRERRKHAHCRMASLLGRGMVLQLTRAFRSWCQRCARVCKVNRTRVQLVWWLKLRLLETAISRWRVLPMSRLLLGRAQYRSVKVPWAWARWNHNRPHAVREHLMVCVSTDMAPLFRCRRVIRALRDLCAVARMWERARLCAPLPRSLRQAFTSWAAHFVSFYRAAVALGCNHRRHLEKAFTQLARFQRDAAQLRHMEVVARCVDRLHRLRRFNAWAGAATKLKRVRVREGAVALRCRQRALRAFIVELAAFSAEQSNIRRRFRLSLLVRAFETWARRAEAMRLAEPLAVNVLQLRAQARSRALLAAFSSWVGRRVRAVAIEVSSRLLASRIARLRLAAGLAAIQLASVRTISFKHESDLIVAADRRVFRAYTHWVRSLLRRSIVGDAISTFAQHVRKRMLRSRMQQLQHYVRWRAHAIGATQHVSLSSIGEHFRRLRVTAEVGALVARGSSRRRTRALRRAWLGMICHVLLHRRLDRAEGLRPRLHYARTLRAWRLWVLVRTDELGDEMRAASRASPRLARRAFALFVAFSCRARRLACAEQRASEGIAYRARVRAVAAWLSGHGARVVAARTLLALLRCAETMLTRTNARALLRALARLRVVAAARARAVLLQRRVEQSEMSSALQLLRHESSRRAIRATCAFTQRQQALRDALHTLLMAAVASARLSRLSSRLRCKQAVEHTLKLWRGGVLASERQRDLEASARRFGERFDLRRAMCALADAAQTGRAFSCANTVCDRLAVSMCWRTWHAKMARRCRWRLADAVLRWRSMLAERAQWHGQLASLSRGRPAAGVAAALAKLRFHAAERGRLLHASEIIRVVLLNTALCTSLRGWRARALDGQAWTAIQTRVAFVLSTALTLRHWKTSVANIIQRRAARERSTVHLVRRTFAIFRTCVSSHARAPRLFRAAASRFLRNKCRVGFRHLCSAIVRDAEHMASLRRGGDVFRRKTLICWRTTAVAKSRRYLRAADSSTHWQTSSLRGFLRRWHARSLAWRQLDLCVVSFWFDVTRRATFRRGLGVWLVATGHCERKLVHRQRLRRLLLALQVAISAWLAHLRLRAHGENVCQELGHLTALQRTRRAWARWRAHCNRQHCWVRDFVVIHQNALARAAHSLHTWQRLLVYSQREREHEAVALACWHRTQGKRGLIQMRRCAACRAQQAVYSVALQWTASSRRRAFASWRQLWTRRITLISSFGERALRRKVSDSFGMWTTLVQFWRRVLIRRSRASLRQAVQTLRGRVARARRLVRLQTDARTLARRERRAAALALARLRAWRMQTVAVRGGIERRDKQGLQLAMLRWCGYARLQARFTRRRRRLSLALAFQRMAQPMIRVDAQQLVAQTHAARALADGWRRWGRHRLVGEWFSMQIMRSRQLWRDRARLKALTAWSGTHQARSGWLCASRHVREATLRRTQRRLLASLALHRDSRTLCVRALASWRRGALSSSFLAWWTGLLASSAVTRQLRQATLHALRRGWRCVVRFQMISRQVNDILRRSSVRVRRCMRTWEAVRRRHLRRMFAKISARRAIWYLRLNNAWHVRQSIRLTMAGAFRIQRLGHKLLAGLAVAAGEQMAEERRMLERAATCWVRLELPRSFDRIRRACAARAWALKFSTMTSGLCVERDKLAALVLWRGRAQESARAEHRAEAHQLRAKARAWNHLFEFRYVDTSSKSPTLRRAAARNARAGLDKGLACWHQAVLRRVRALAAEFTAEKRWMFTGHRIGFFAIKRRARYRHAYVLSLALAARGSFDLRRALLRLHWHHLLAHKAEARATSTVKRRTFGIFARLHRHCIMGHKARERATSTARRRLFSRWRTRACTRAVVSFASARWRRRVLASTFLLLVLQSLSGEGETEVLVHIDGKRLAAAWRVWALRPRVHLAHRECIGWLRASRALRAVHLVWRHWVVWARIQATGWATERDAASHSRGAAFLHWRAVMAHGWLVPQRVASQCQLLSITKAFVKLARFAMFQQRSQGRAAHVAAYRRRQVLQQWAAAARTQRAAVEHNGLANRYCKHRRVRAAFTSFAVAAALDS